jgi:dihydroorotate dehydrogenase
MYKYLIRPLLFLFSPETIHYIIVLILKIVFNIPGLSWLLGLLFKVRDKRLEREFGGLRFSNPVGLAAGFDKNASLFNELSNFGFSFIEIGTVTPEPQPGNKRPRSFRLVKDSSLINRMGFNNTGVDKVARKLKKRKRSIIIGGNIGKNTVTDNENACKDYEACFRKLYEYVDYIAVNVSCPNINNLTELQDYKSLDNIIGRLTEIRKEQAEYKPVIIKISPDLSSNELDEILDICSKYEIDGIIATNTTISREGLRTAQARLEKIGSGGLSGKPLRDRSTAIIKYIISKTGGKLPVIGVGGIMSPADAVEKIKAGASLVQVYTGFIYEGPFLAKRINKAVLKINK